MSWLSSSRGADRRVNAMMDEASSMGVHQQGKVLIPIFIATILVMFASMLIAECSLYELGTAIQCVFHTGSPFDAYYIGDVGHWACNPPEQRIYVDERLSFIGGVFAYSSPIWIIVSASMISRRLLRREAERVQRIMDAPLAPEDDWR